jgi:hypothetical protein
MEKKRFYGLTGLKLDSFSVFILGKTAQVYYRPSLETDDKMFELNM